jgi:hypothetical protein
MDNRTLVLPQSFCSNASCLAYGQVDLGNIRKFGLTPAGLQRYQCRICPHTFVETIGTVFYGRRRPQETIIECLAVKSRTQQLGRYPPRQRCERRDGDGMVAHRCRTRRADFRPPACILPSEERPIGCDVGLCR